MDFDGATHSVVKSIKQRDLLNTMTAPFHFLDLTSLA